MRYLVVTVKIGRGDMMADAIVLFTMVVEAAIPYAVVFALGNRVVSTFLGMAFKGEVRL